MDTTILLKALSKPAIKASMPLFRALKDRVHHAFNDGMIEYFSASLDKYKNIKTLLHRQPTPFYNIYFPTTLVDKGTRQDISTNSVESLFKEYNCITIIGDAGSGKSTLLKHLFISTFVENYKAPIFVNLRDLDLTTSNLDEFLCSHILQNKLSPSEDFIKKLLKNGEFLFFLDGYDEIKSSEKHQITKNLENFIDIYPNNNFLLTSRPYSSIEFFKNFRNFHIKDMEKTCQISFIKQQIIDTRLSTKIVDSIKDSSDRYIQSFFKNALLLTLYIMAYSKNSSIPNKKYIFYRRVFDVLFAEHDSATKIGYEREIKSQLNQESLEYVLKVFCFLSYFESQFDFKKDYIFKQLGIIKDKSDFKFKNNDFIDDMKLSIGLWSEDCGVYSFAHRSMQEYFASVHLTNMKSIKHKKIVYKKIMALTYDMDFNVTNFLSLCYEMDEQFFIENYSIKLIKKLKKLIINNNGDYNLSLPYLGNGIFESNSGKENTHIKSYSYGVTKDTMIAAGSYITPKVSYGFFHEVALIITSNIHHKDFNKFITIKNKGSNNHQVGYYLPQKIFKLGYKEFLEEIGVFDEFDNIIKKLDKILLNLEKQVSTGKNIEESFAAMI
ncbi:MAG: NACHT domain-containing protein [Colwellia sp.]|uniref:NACHT domain-containing protein n=1 Tax=Alteromonadales TaxID=135622 RepID=UPI001DF463F9|nr:MULTISPECIES: NACHT domain-containing protein [Alteromonadales]NQZ28309.1 NACHT domain-containing protein [Colwellia sp.]NRA81910.1 NACHT domain-containing protein [Pseudoalteromonas sp.]